MAWHQYASVGVQNPAFSVPIFCCLFFTCLMKPSSNRRKQNPLIPFHYEQMESCNSMRKTILWKHLALKSIIIWSRTWKRRHYKPYLDKVFTIWDMVYVYIWLCSKNVLKTESSRILPLWPIPTQYLLCRRKAF